MALKFADIAGTDTEEIFTVLVPIVTKKGDKAELEVKYIAPTEEISYYSLAKQLAYLIQSWGIEDHAPTEQFLRTQPLAFLRQLLDAITGDYFPKSRN